MMLKMLNAILRNRFLTSWNTKCIVKEIKDLNYKTSDAYRNGYIVAEFFSSYSTLDGHEIWSLVNFQMKLEGS